MKNSSSLMKHLYGENSLKNKNKNNEPLWVGGHKSSWCERCEEDHNNYLIPPIGAQPDRLASVMRVPANDCHNKGIVGYKKDIAPVVDIFVGVNDLEEKDRVERFAEHHFQHCVDSEYPEVMAAMETLVGQGKQLSDFVTKEEEEKESAAVPPFRP